MPELPLVVLAQPASASVLATSIAANDLPYIVLPFNYSSLPLEDATLTMVILDVGNLRENARWSLRRKSEESPQIEGGAAGDVNPSNYVRCGSEFVRLVERIHHRFG
ncbi:hypothetical protein [Rhodococcus sp. 1168]|uniref:hypothetical protein n=1 Tax=Rhodococcus sp. 1168 TaxID=2018041 RepID=UPI001C395210|nr:hypothetical protein [Rhodococcus sp. 1168]